MATKVLAVSLVLAACCRVVEVHAPGLWDGPRPGIVVNTFGDNRRINVNVFLDGANDSEVLSQLKNSEQGNTFTSVPLYDKDQEPEDRERDATTTHPAYGEQRLQVWCCWPVAQQVRSDPRVGDAKVSGGYANPDAKTVRTPADIAGAIGATGGPTGSGDTAASAGRTIGVDPGSPEGDKSVTTNVPVAGATAGDPSP